MTYRYIELAMEHCAESLILREMLPWHEIRALILTVSDD